MNTALKATPEDWMVERNICKNNWKRTERALVVAKEALRQVSESTDTILEAEAVASGALMDIAEVEENMTAIHPETRCEDAMRDVFEIAENAGNYSGRHQNALRLEEAMDKVAVIARQVLSQAGVVSW